MCREYIPESLKLSSRTLHRDTFCPLLDSCTVGPYCTIYCTSIFLMFIFWFLVFLPNDFLRCALGLFSCISCWLFCCLLVMFFFCFFFCRHLLLLCQPISSVQKFTPHPGVPRRPVGKSMFISVVLLRSVMVFVSKYNVILILLKYRASWFIFLSWTKSKRHCETKCDPSMLCGAFNVNSF